MRRSVLALAAAASLLVIAPLQAADALLFDRFRDYLDSLRTQAGIPGLSATIVGPTDVLWEHASGLQDVERNIGARPDTPYHIDGLTQTITAALALRCAEHLIDNRREQKEAR